MGGLCVWVGGLCVCVSEKDVRAVRYVWGGRIVKGLLKAIERFAWSWESHSYSEEFCCSTRQSSVLRLE